MCDDKTPYKDFGRGYPIRHKDKNMPRKYEGYLREFNVLAVNVNCTAATKMTSVFLPTSYTFVYLLVMYST